MKKLLEVKDLGINFGGLAALSRFDLELDKGEIVGLIGPNGAGKTTVFNLLTGVYEPSSGFINLKGRSLVGKPSHKIVDYGIARTFQNIRLFKDISVIDNVKIAMNSSMKYSVFSAILRFRDLWREEKEAHRRALELLDVFSLREYADMPAGSLPYGKQRKLEIARALATNPEVLLLDEPAAGMNPTETKELMETIRLIRDKFNVAVLLIEHDMSLVMGICERIAVLDYGVLIAVGTPHEIANDKRVITAYLGE